MTVTEPTILPLAKDMAPDEPKLARIHTSSEPSEQDRQVAARVLRLFQIARDHRRSMLPRWRQNYRMLFNRYWGPGRESWLPAPQITEILPIIRASVGFMTDQRITHNISPAAIPGNDYAQFFSSLADTLETTMLATWCANLEEREWTTSIWDGFVYGAGIQKTSWESDLAGGIGDAMARRVHPFHFYPDPRATTEHDGDYYIESREMSVEELDRRFPGAGEFFRSGGTGATDSDLLDRPPSNIDWSGRAGPSGNPGPISPATSPQYARARDGARDMNLPGVHVLECWVREYEFVSTTDTRTGTEVKKAKSSWRVIVVAEGRVLMNEPAKNLWDHGQHPYSRFAPIDIGEFWGPAMVELLISPQQSINKILASLQQNVELTGNPIWKETAAGGLRRTPIINRPGQRVEVGNAMVDKSGWEQPPRMDQSMMQLLNFLLSRMEVISGIAAMQKGGGAPGGRNAEGVIEAVQESAFVGIRLAQRNLEYAMTTSGEKKADLIIENYTQPRLLAIAGPDREREMLALKARHFQIPTNEGAVPLKYQLYVDAGSRRHTARQVMEERAVQLFTLGAIDRSALLKSVDWPNATKVAEEQDAREAQLAAMGEAAGPGQRQRARA